MSKIVISGNSDEGLSQILGNTEFYDLSENSANEIINKMQDTDICVTLKSNAISDLTDTMTCRSYFENIKNQNITTLMHAVAAREYDQVNWLMYMGMVLPYVDIFYSTYKDALWLFENSLYEQYHANADAELCDQISLSILNMGCALVVLDLEDEGVYLRSSSVKPRLESIGNCNFSNVDNWWARELYSSNCSECQSNTYNKLAGLLNALEDKLNPAEFITNTANKYCCNSTQSIKPLASAFVNWNTKNSIACGPFDKIEA